MLHFKLCFRIFWVDSVCMKILLSPLCTHIQLCNSCFQASVLASSSTAAAATLSLANSDVSLLNYQSALYPSSAAPVPGVAQQGVSLQPGTTQICTQTDPFQQTFIVCPPAFQSKWGNSCIIWYQNRSIRFREILIKYLVLQF